MAAGVRASGMLRVRGSEGAETAGCRGCGGGGWWMGDSEREEAGDGYSDRLGVFGELERWRGREVVSAGRDWDRDDGDGDWDASAR